MPREQYNVDLIKISKYDADAIFEVLPEELFFCILPGNTVVLKPNWVLAEHQYNCGEWEQVITHPALITAVIRRVIDRLDNKGKIIIADGPELSADFDKILSYQPISEWRELCKEHQINLEIIDLREELYIIDKNVTVSKLKLPGDTRGKVVANLINDRSEFYKHSKSEKGYFGAGSDIEEVNWAHDGYTNLYSVSKSVIDADVFINLPKLKTHKKGGITCSLKNLVGINTYRNYLPHNSIGTPRDGGDQFPGSDSKSLIESRLMPFIHQYVLKNLFLARIFSPIMTLGKKLFGDNRETIRGGSWYGNDTIWRMILDINKVLFYVNPDGSFRESSISNMKRYISIVDGIIAGEGNGPKAPDSIKVGYLIAGVNPVSVDTACARIMNFDFQKIPTINNAYDIKYFPLVDFKPEDIRIKYDDMIYSIIDLPSNVAVTFKPHKGWIGHIEFSKNVTKY